MRGKSFKIKINKKIISITISPILLCITLFFVHCYFRSQFTEVIFVISFFLMILCYEIILFIPDVLKSDNSLYSWLDSLNGGDEILHELFKGIPQKNVMENLEIVKKKLLFYTNQDIEKLKLLQAYFKALEIEDIEKSYFKVTLGMFIALIINLVSKKNDWLSKFIEGDLNHVEFIGSIVTLLSVLIAVIAFLKHYHRGRKRNKLISEIIDVCIEKK
jgi:hypothetical protein